MHQSNHMFHHHFYLLHFFQLIHQILRHLKDENTIISATRVEPSLHPASEEKYTQDSDTMNPHRLSAILQEANEAMNRYNAKLRREISNNAKQKQIKG